MLEGKRILVVGASRGIGLAIGRACAGAGACVALAARSTDALDVAAKDCGEKTIAVSCDVRDEARCAATVDEVVDRFGGLDGLVYTAGVSVFRRVGELSMDDFHTLFETNAFGAARMTAAALPHLEAASGHAVFLSSESALYYPTPWRGIGGYIAAKRALESLVASFQLEYPAVAFTNYVAGPTLTEFGSEDPDNLVAEFIPEWVDRGYFSVTGVLQPEDHAQMVLDILTLPRRVLIDRVNVRVRGPH